MHMFRYLLLAAVALPALAQAQSINTPPIAPTAGMLDIKAYGAKCDGVTDDQPAITAAIAAASSGPIRVVYSPPSQTPCMIGSTIVLPAAGVTLFAYPGTQSWKATATNSSSPQLFSGEANWSSNVLVYGLDLDGNVQGQFAAGGALMKTRLNGFVRGNNVVFDHVNIHDTAGQALQFSTRMTHSGIRSSTLSNIGLHYMKTGLLADVQQGMSFLSQNGIFTGSISGSVLTVSAILFPSSVIGNGNSVFGAGVTSGTRIVSSGTGAGGTGTYNLNITYGSPVSSETMSSHDQDLNVGNFAEDNTFIAFGGGPVNAYAQTGFSAQRNKCFLGVDAAFTASMSGTSLSVTAVASGLLKVGQIVYGLGVPDGTKIVSIGSALGSTGTYTTNAPVGTSVASRTMYTAGFMGQSLPSLQSYFSNVGQPCIFVVGSRGVTIADNQSWVASEGAYPVAGVRDYVISGNYARYNYNYGTAITTGLSYGFVEGSYNGSVTGNTIVNTGMQFAGTGATAGVLIFTASGVTAPGPILNLVIAGNNFVTDDPAVTLGYGVAVSDAGAGLPTMRDVQIADSNQFLGMVQGVLLNLSATVSGCSATAVIGSQRAGKFTSGTTGTCTPVITVGGTNNPQTAPNGYACTGIDVTTGAALAQTATTTTTCTLSGATTSGNTVAFSAVPY
jgi:hypothetical protein